MRCLFSEKIINNRCKQRFDLKTKNFFRMQKLITFSLLSFFVLTSISLFAQEEYGLASYYGDEFDGRATAYGETYHKEAFTAAHKKYPKGTMLKVTRIDNNKSVTVRVNDKGPFVKGRIIDLSRAAAEKIGLIDAGVAEVKIKVVGKKSQSEIAKAKKTKVTAAKEEVIETPKGYADDYDMAAQERAAKEKAAKEKEKAAKLKAIKERQARKKKAATVHERIDEINRKKAAAEKKKSAKPAPKAKANVKKRNEKKGTVNGVYKVTNGEDAPSGYTVQIFSTGSHNLMEEEIVKLKAKWFKGFILSVEEHKGNAKFNVSLKHFDKLAAAKNYKKNLAKKYKINGFVTEVGQPKTKEGKSTGTKLNIDKVEKGTYGVQVASLNNYKSFLKEYKKLDKKGFEDILMGIKNDGKFKAILGEFQSKDEAKTYQRNLVKKYKIKGFVISLDGF